MAQQLFEALFVVSLVALVMAPIIGVLLLALPRSNTERAVHTHQIHAHV
jgi:hypothetical protein